MFEGYELGDALDRANEALEDDVQRARGRRPSGGREAVHAKGGPAAPRALVLQPRSRRRGAVLASRRLVRIRVGHSPDPDDAFMYWALTTDLVETRGHEFEQVLGDIQTLNQWARAGRLEVTAISLAAYPFVQEDYALLPHGASIGSGYGPDRRRARAADARRAPRARDRRAGHDDDVVPRAAARARRVRASRARVRRDPRGGRVGASGRGAAHPRGAAHVRGLRSRQGARPRRVVAARDRAAASARRERRASRSRRRRALRRLRRYCATRSSAASTTARRRSSTRSSSAAGSTRPSPTGSSRCT